MNMVSYEKMKKDVVQEIFEEFMFHKLSTRITERVNLLFTNKCKLALKNIRLIYRLKTYVPLVVIEMCIIGSREAFNTELQV